MQQRCKIEAVEKYTSIEFQTSHIRLPNIHFPRVISVEKLNSIAPKTTNISANARDTTNRFAISLSFRCLATATITSRLPKRAPAIIDNITHDFKTINARSSVSEASPSPMHSFVENISS